MISTPENLRQRFERVSREQKRTLVVCADDFRRDEHGVYNHDGDMGLIGWSMAESVFRDLLWHVDYAVALAGAPGAGKSTWIAANKVPGVLYLDAMLARRHTRRAVCAMATAVAKPIDCVFLDVGLETCMVRNQTRPCGRVVPDEYLRGAHHRLSVCPPDLDEGWRSVVRLAVPQDASSSP